MAAAPVSSAAIDEGSYTLVNLEAFVADGGSDGETDGGYVSCPAGQRIVAEGTFWHAAGTGPEPGNSYDTQIGSNFPTLDALGMFSSGWNRAISRYRQSVLLCLPSSTIGTPYTTVAADSAAIAANSAGGYLPCPPGKRVVSGGAFWHLPGQGPDHALAADSRVTSSTPTTDGLGWYADGLNFSTTPRVFTIVAHCLPSGEFGPYTILNPDFADAGLAHATGGYVRCPAGRRIVTGGAFWHEPGEGPDPSNAGTTFLGSSTPTTDGLGWYVDGSNHVTTKLLQTVLLCITPKLRPAAPAATPGLTGQRAAALKKCKKKAKKQHLSKKARKKCRRHARRLPV